MGENRGVSVLALTRDAIDSLAVVCPNFTESLYELCAASAALQGVSSSSLKSSMPTLRKTIQESCKRRCEYRSVCVLSTSRPEWLGFLLDPLSRKAMEVTRSW